MSNRCANSAHRTRAKRGTFGTELHANCTEVVLEGLKTVRNILIYMVPRGGIEPPTRGFSVRSSVRKRHKTPCKPIPYYPIKPRFFPKNRRIWCRITPAGAAILCESLCHKKACLHHKLHQKLPCSLSPKQRFIHLLPIPSLEEGTLHSSPPVTHRTATQGACRVSHLHLPLTGCEAGLLGDLLTPP